jgi:hypothetical protein
MRSSLGLPLARADNGADLEALPMDAHIPRGGTQGEHERFTCQRPGPLQVSLPLGNQRLPI